MNEHRLKESKVETSEELLNQLHDIIPFAIILIDSDGSILYRSREFESLVGYTAEDISSEKEWWLLAYPDEKYREHVRRAWKKEINRAIRENDKPKPQEWIVTCKDGSKKDIEFTTVIVGDKILVTLKDITKSKKTEESLKLAEYMIENVSDMVFLVTPEGRFLYVNRAATDILGYTKEQLLNMGPLDINPEYTPEKWKEHVKELKDTKTLNFQSVSRMKNGQVFPVEVRANLLEYEGRDYIFTFVRDISDRVRTEEGLRLTQFAVDHAPDTIYWINQDAKFIYANNEASRYLGYTREELLTMSVFDIDIDFTPDIWAAHWQDIKQHGSVTVETRHRAKDGNIIFMEISANYVEFAGKEYNCAFARDITERKRAEEALKQEKALTDAILDSVPGTLFVINDQGHYIRWNKKFEEISTFSIEEIPHVSPLQDMPWAGDSQSKAQAAVEQVLSQGYSEVELSFIARDGEEKLFFFTTVRMIVDNKPHIVGIGTDITERKRIEEDLAITNEELRILNRIIAETTSVADLQVILDIAVEEATRIVGLEGSMVYLIKPDDTFELAAYRAISDETAAEMEKETIKKGEHPCAVCMETGIPLIMSTRQEVHELTKKEIFEKEDIRFIAAFPLLVEAECVGVLCIFTQTDKKPTKRNLDLLESATKQIAAAIKRAKLFDEVKRNAEILEQRVTERTLQLENVNRELESFSYSVSHDLRNPLRAIDGFSMILMEDYTDKVDAEVLNYLTRIRTAAVRMGVLIDDILRLSRVSRVEMTRSTIDLSEIAQTIAAGLTERQPERKVEFIIEPDLVANADANLMRIALENLFDNAWKFTSKQDAARIEFGATCEEGKTVYYIKDNGVGFDQAYVNKLFVAFQRLHSEAEFPGTGVGLATVKRIISRHGGEIWAVGEVGKGAAFYFTLPNGMPTETGQ